MVASTVGKLSALLAADLSDEQAQRLGLDTLLPLREATARRCSASIPPPASHGSSACWRAISARAGRLPVFSRRARRPMASAASLDEVCEHHLRTLLAQQPHGPYYLFGYSLGGTLAGDCRPLAPARRSGGLPRPAGYGRRRRKTGQRKRPTGWIPRYWRRSTASAKRSSPPSRGKPPASCSAPSKATMPMRCGC